MQAIWYRDKREVTEDEYEAFYENLANTKIPYKYKLHYSTDVPLAIKAIFYVPGTHQERIQLMSEESKINLYSRKVLIKESCKELVPPYLRFVKGIVDCEDLPLNISRETYQDSSLIRKLSNVVTRRILKFIEDEMKRDVADYENWYKNFQQFIKEGIMSDQENQEQLLRLVRYQISTSSLDKSVSLDDYVRAMKDGQKKIYFVSGASEDQINSNPFMEPFLDSDLPVLIVGNQVDEMIFQQIGMYKSFHFVNVESGYDEISRDIENSKKGQDDLNKPSLPDEDVTNFCLWLKDTTKPYVGKVSLSKRLKSSPAVLYGQISANMRMMMSLMQQQSEDPAEANRQMEMMSHNQTLEINPNHQVMIKLN
mmetsp:Transcript_12567/g.21153  ORF Transcript_12567/g.21153 Transcript_12567/m.21153 type:complete len:367 (+) Transcript_12567:383-1483(+)